MVLSKGKKSSWTKFNDMNAGSSDLKSIAILVRSFSLGGGLEKYNFKLTQGLLDANYKVTILCENNNSDFKHKNLTVQEIFKTSQKLNASQKLKFFFDTSNEYLSHNTFDLVHSQHLPTSMADVVSFHNYTVATRVTSGKIAENIIDKLKSKFKGKYLSQNFYDLTLVNSAKALIFPSKMALNDYVDKFKITNLEKLFVAYPGLGYPCEVTYNKDKIPLNLVFVGKGYRHKGLDVLLKAISLLKRENIIVNLNVVGLKKTLFYKFKLLTLGIGSQVKFLGRVFDLAELYANCDIIVQPSRYETFGMAVLEAMQYHVVPVVSKKCGISEILTDDVNAIILDDHLSAYTLAKSLKALIENQAHRHKLACASEELSYSYPWENTVYNTLEAYKYALKEKLYV